MEAPGWREVKALVARASLGTFVRVIPMAHFPGRRALLASRPDMGEKGGKKLSRTTYMDSYGRQPWRDHTGNFWDGYIEGKPQPSSTGQERQQLTKRHCRRAFFVTVGILCIGAITAGVIYDTHNGTAHSQTPGTPTTFLTTPTKPTTPAKSTTPTKVYQYEGKGLSFLDMATCKAPSCLLTIAS